jgi:glycosyltransferase involved in cell wall biosynthesis
MTDFSIVLSEPIKDRVGGPAGYLFNLKQGIKDEQLIKFYYVELNDTNQNTKTNKFKSIIKKIISKIKIIRCILIEIKLVLHYLAYQESSSFDKNTIDKILSSKYIHFHKVYDLYMFKKKFNIKAKTVLTPHTPEPRTNEIINSLKDSIKTKYPFFLLKFILKKMEIYAYKNADIYIFPSEESIEPFKKYFKEFTDYIKNKKIYYLFTGTSKLVPIKLPEEYKKELKISDEYKIIVYIGRHNFIKGYDLLVKAFDRLKDYKIKIICAGNITFDYPQNSNWIELGYIKNPQDLINIADAVILPNRETFFDLIAIEVLSMGKILIASNTGGNKTLAKYTNGVILFENENLENMIQKINYVLNLDCEKIEQMKYNNLAFYNSYCTIDKFAEKYKEIVSEIINDTY